MLRRLVVLLILPLLLCGCNKVDKTVITFSSWGSITEVSILKKLISEYEKENPDIKINFLHIPQNYFQKLHLLFASSQAPDVIFINNLYLPVYASHLEDLTNLIDRSVYYQESLKSLSVGEKLYAVPRDISTLIFYRNKEIIPQTPINLEDLMQILEHNKENFGISFEPDVYYMFPYSLTMGEDIFKPEKSLKFYKNLEGRYAPSPPEVGSSTLAQMFLDEKIGLYLSGRWMYPKIKEKAAFSWDVITFPGIVPLDSSGWAMSKRSKNKDEAWKFITYLSSKPSSEYFLKSGLLVPARIDVAQEIDNKVFLKAIEKSKAINIDKNYKKNIDIMNNKFF